LQGALKAGKEILSNGGTSLDAVEAVVVMLEDDPQFNAGKGAAFNRVGAHELDASIMDGSNLRCGAMAAAKFVKNPIKAARLIMERSPHVLLVAEGADRFAIENGCERVEQDYFYTDRRWRELQEALAKQDLEPLAKPAYSTSPHDPEATATDKPALEGAGGTVGCVALDSRGRLAAATSTGGLAGKLPGRIGDTPICGAGNFADKNCAVSATGKGEEYIRHQIAAKVAWLMAERRLTVDEAVRHCLSEILKPGDGGLVVVDRDGNVFMRATTSAMPRGFADSTGRFETAIWVETQVSR
jgi:beta-aspartyl-peptidase (threonine type)